MGSGLIRKQNITERHTALARELRQAMTPAERRFWTAVRGKKLNGLHFRRQQWIEGFIADFYCEKLKLVIEIDGGVHERQKGYDRMRDTAIRKQELQVLRFRNDEVMGGINGVIAKIKSLASSPPPTSPSTSLSHREREGENGSER